MNDLVLATAAVVSVGDGRGFLVDGFRVLPSFDDTGAPVEVRAAYVVTAAHCLPSLPPPLPAAYVEERTFHDLIGELREPRKLSAECVFVDPVADVAVLCGPDGQTYFDESEAFESFVDDRPRFEIGPVEPGTQGWMLRLDGTWCATSITANHASARHLAVDDVSVAGGMSGSPIVGAAGRAVGLVSTVTKLSSIPNADAEMLAKLPPYGFNPCLAETLPAWLLRQFRLR